MLWLTLRRLRSKDLDTRVAAFARAARRRDLDALLAVVDDPDQYIRDDAIKALGEIGDPRAVPALIRRLDDPNHNNVEDAARALARVGDRRAVGPLIAVLRSAKQHQQARGVAADELAKIADAQAVPALLEALAGADAWARYFLLKILGTIGDGRAVPAAVAALNDPDADVRWKAVEALGSLGDARAVAPLLALLPQAGTGRGPDHQAIIKALGRIGDERAKTALVPFLRHDGTAVREAAAAALDAVGWLPSNATERAQHAVAGQRWDQLARVDWEAARAALVEALRSSDGWVRDQAVATLAEIGGRRAFESLVGVLTHPQDYLANAAALALARIDDVRAVVPLLDYCRRFELTGGYRNNPGAPYEEKARADRATEPLVQLLKRTVAQVAPDVLKTLAAQEDRRFYSSVEYDTPGYGDGRDDFEVVQSFARVRRVAGKECSRRGLA